MARIRDRGIRALPQRWMLPLPDNSARPSAGPDVLVVRAVFVPDGDQPPPEFAGDFNPLQMRATRDPATGEITCDAAGTVFGGDIRAEWYPLHETEFEVAEAPDAPGDGAA